MMQLSLILCSLYFSLSSGFDLRKLELLDNDINGDQRGDNDEWYRDYDKSHGLEFSVGAIIGIAFGTIALLFALPILLCFCCAWCCFRRRSSKSTVVQVVAAPVPQQYNNNADVHSQIATTQTYGSTSDVNQQNTHKDNIGFSVYPGSGDNLHAIQSTSQNYNYSNSVPVPNPSFTTDNQMNQDHIYEQPPPYYDVAVQSAERYQSRSNEASKSTTNDS